MAQLVCWVTLIIGRGSFAHVNIYLRGGYHSGRVDFLTSDVDWLAYITGCWKSCHLIHFSTVVFPQIKFWLLSVMWLRSQTSEFILFCQLDMRGDMFCLLSAHPL